ncbi:MAG: histidine phosphatase family protein [Verrucomicrobia bacterium]|nr:histidine phosphatase family protein [Verrucomicrobiota bacterium]
MSKKNLHQNIYLIRHGETEWTLSKKHTSLTDIPLTENGRKQVVWLKDKLAEKKFKKVLCSPLLRAKETCQLTALFEHAEVDPDLVEWNYGDYEGKTTAEIREIRPKWSIFNDGAPNGESIGDVSARAMRIIAKARAVPGDVAIFSSGHFLRALAAKWLNKPVTEGKFFLLSTASLSILGYERETPVLVTWNQTES